MLRGGRLLLCFIKKEKGKAYCTGEIRLIDFAEDCLREIERLEKLVEGKESEKE